MLIWNSGPRFARQRVSIKKQTHDSNTAQETEQSNPLERKFRTEGKMLHLRRKRYVVKNIVMQVP